MPVELLHGRPLSAEELEMIRQQIEEGFDNITEVDSEIRGIVAATGLTYCRSCRRKRNKSRPLVWDGWPRHCTPPSRFRICWQRATAIFFMAKRLIFVRPDGTPCTTKSGEVANSGAPLVLVAFGEYDAMRLRQFASEHGGALVQGWELFRQASLFNEAAE